MNQNNIDKIVQSVLAKIGQEKTVAVTPVAVAPAAPAEPPAPTVRTATEDCNTIHSDNRIGVLNPKRVEVLRDFVGSTASRVAVGRAGLRPKTRELLNFLIDHSRSKDTVLKDFPDGWVEKSGLLELRTEIVEKDQFLTRPDLGRKLAAESVVVAQNQCKKNPQVQVIVSDGLSTDAVVANFDEIIPALLNGLNSNGLDVGTPIFVRHGRVKVEDHIGEILSAQVVILLIGERPGLGQSESLSCYMVHSPTVSQTVESDRICISNIHSAGTPPVEAAAVIVNLAKKFLRDGKNLSVQK